MNIRVWLPDLEPLSKQHSARRSHGRGKRMMFKDPRYAGEMNYLRWLAKAEFAKRGWTEPVTCRCALRVSYRGRFDPDNAGGYVQDALQGVAYVRDSQLDLATYRKRRSGPVGILIIVHTLEGRKANEKAKRKATGKAGGAMAAR